MEAAGWYACRTRPRAEKQVAARLIARGFESYLPLVARVQQWADRKKRVEFPLFPGYAFAWFGLRDARAVVTTPGVAGIVGVAGRPVPVRDDEIASLRALEAGIRQTGELPRVEEYLEPGREVVVATGAFSGMRGLLIEQRGASRVVVRLAALRQAVSVELPRGAVRAVA